MSITELIALIISGIFVGFINTLAGGGSIISLSILMFLGLPPGIANATNRVAISLQTITATINFKRNKVLDTKKALLLSIPTVAGAVLGSYIAVDINEEIFEKAIAVIMLVMIVFIFLQPKKWLTDRQDLIDKKVGPLHYMIFFAIGVYGGFIHIGVGYFFLMAIVLLGGYNLVKANAIKIFIVMMYVPVSLIIFVINDQVNWQYGLTLSIGNIIGAFIASKYAAEKGASFVRWVILVVVILTAANTFGFIDIKSMFSHI